MESRNGNRRNKSWSKKEDKVPTNTDASYQELMYLLPGRSLNAISMRAKRLGFKRTCRLRKSRNYKALLENEKFCEIVDGELLGDGCITRSKSNYYCFSYCSSNEEYVRYLHKILCSYTGSEGSVYYAPPAEEENRHFINGREVIGKGSYGFIMSHKVFETFYQRWYNGGDKHVPMDVRISPKSCLHWYIGDGTIDSTPVITMCTQCFNSTDHELLIDRLMEVGIESFTNNTKNKLFLRISAENTIKFLKYIGECPVQSYRYKWEIGNYRLIEKACHCGRLFSYFRHSDKWKNYCSDQCRQKAKLLKSKRIICTKRLDSVLV